MGFDIYKASVEDWHKRYGFDVDCEDNVEELIRRDAERRETQDGNPLHPVYTKHLPVCWSIQEIYQLEENGHISRGKARELVAAVIEEHINNLNK